MVETRDIALAGIAILPQRMRSLRQEIVDSLADSMKAQGLLQPIVLRPSDATGYYLVAGRHRHAAARKLGWSAIRATIIDPVDADAALLAEIDENLIRADLSPAERAAHVAARRDVYELIKGKAKANGAAAANASMGHKFDANAKSAFALETAKATGKSVRVVQEEGQRGASIPDVASLAGTSLDKTKELDALGKLGAANPTKRDELIKRAKGGEKVSALTELKKDARETREKVLGAIQQRLPSKKYGVILADPEWRFEPWSRTTGMDRAADNHYPTSCTEVIAARDVPSIAADDCVLFLWAIAPMLPHALLVMAAWGFEYKSHLIWDKQRQGTGYWFRNAHELLLVGTRGNVPAPAMGMQAKSVQSIEAGEHSAKPEAIHRIIEHYFPTLPKIELNRRGAARPGWDSWGNEATETEAPPSLVEPAVTGPSSPEAVGSPNCENAAQ